MAGSDDGRRVQERGLATRAALLDAALECLIERGHAATTTIEVARRAGVSRGAQQHHFQSRAHLLVALVEHLFERRTAEFRKAVADIPPSRDHIDAGVDLLWSLFEGPMFTAWVEVWLAARTDPELRTAVVEMDRRTTEVIRAVTAELIPPSEGFDPQVVEVARSFGFLVMDGLALRRLLPHDHDAPVSLVIETLKTVTRMALSARSREGEAMTVTTKSLEDAPFVDIFSPELIDNPAPVIDRLRQESGLVRTPIGGMVIRRDLVVALLADRRLRSSVPDVVRMQGLTDGPVLELLDSSLLALEGEAHLRLRRLVNRAFTPRAVDPHRSVMRDILGSLLEPVVGRGHCEFMGEIADHYPIQVMCHLLGVPEEDHDDFAAWNKAVTWVLSFELSTHREEAEWGSAQLDGYVVRLIEDRRRQPRDDMVTALVQAEEAGDRLSDIELRSMIGGLLFAGFDTTRNQLGLAMALFAEHPEQWALLGDRPELVPRAVEEVMRYYGAIGVAPRMVMEDLDIDGYRVPAGTMLALSTASANFDPAAHDDPATFDITAEREPQLTFGGGAHYCLGANLARAEMQEALALLARSMPDLTLDGEPTWRTPLGIFGPEQLGLRFGPQPDEV